jgi:hypothetical protein
VNFCHVDLSAKPNAASAKTHWACMAHGGKLAHVHVNNNYAMRELSTRKLGHFTHQELFCVQIG